VKNALNDIFFSNAHFSFDLLKTEREPCHPNPCHNGGKCLSTSDGFVCRCATGYRGETCTGVSLVLESDTINASFNKH